MYDHITLTVSDASRSRQFYERVLKPLGLGLDPHLYLQEGAPSKVHIAFKATSKQAVDAFHEAALAAGGRDNGKPGARPDYSATYYAAFVLDPDGNNIEAVVQ